MEPPALGMSEPLDFDSDVPVYEQIGTRIKFAIARGAPAPTRSSPASAPWRAACWSTRTP